MVFHINLHENPNNKLLPQIDLLCYKYNDRSVPISSIQQCLLRFVSHHAKGFIPLVLVEWESFEMELLEMKSIEWKLFKMKKKNYK